jgi:hypothetical protein
MQVAAAAAAAAGRSRASMMLERRGRRAHCSIALPSALGARAPDPARHGQNSGCSVKLRSGGGDGGGIVMAMAMAVGSSPGSARRRARR